MNFGALGLRRVLTPIHKYYNTRVRPHYGAPVLHPRLYHRFKKYTTSSMGSTPSEWDNSPAEFDFRSDTLTTPTKVQLAALQRASLGDDVYRESRTTNTFEERMAEIFGKEKAIFVLSGTMGNQLSLRAILTQPPHAVLCDHRSHILNHEAGGLAMLSQAMPQPVVPSSGQYLTLEDVKNHAILSDNYHYCPTKVISLENTLRGNILPLEEVQRIGQWARENNIKMHLDGARLWNAVSIFETVEEQIKVLKAYSKEFDTVTVCLSKSIGAPVGSVILSTENVIRRARHFRKAIGGGTRQAGVLTAMADAAVEEVFLAGKLKSTNEKAKKIAQFWVKECGGKLEYEVETNMVWLDLRARGIMDGGKEFEEECERVGIKSYEHRIVVHWQNSDEAVDRLCTALKAWVKRFDDSIATGSMGEGIGLAKKHSVY